MMNKTWYNLLLDVMNKGTRSAPRGQKIVELLNNTIEIDMKYPVVTWSKRNMGYRFMVAEAAWILSGDNRVNTIAPWSKEISRFSDDGISFYGAYGPKFIDQTLYVCKTLMADPDTRQAVVNIWRENPGPTKDVPCTINLQFLIRDNKIHTVANMRSSDCWLGVPYDAFNFTMMTATIMLRLRQLGWDKLELGTLYMNAGSRHIYERNFKQVKDVLDSSENDVDFTTPAFDPYTFRDSEHLISHLQALRDLDDWNRDEEEKKWKCTWCKKSNMTGDPIETNYLSSQFLQVHIKKHKAQELGFQPTGVQLKEKKGSNGKGYVISPFTKRY